MLGSFVAGLCAIGALPEQPPGIRYVIEVKLDPADRGLEGREQLHWTNSSTQAIDRVPIHLYLNGFAHSETTWMRTTGRELDFDEYLEREPDPWGWMDLESVEQVTSEGTRPVPWRPILPDRRDVLDRSIVELALPKPVPPGERSELKIAFRGRLPVPVARTGGRNGFFMVAQWFPKLGTLETPGVRGQKRWRWAAGQFHGPTEFYADFAAFDVTMEVPPGWVIGATGQRVAGAAEGQGKHRFTAAWVHDFAWVTGDALSVEETQYIPSVGGPPIAMRYIAPAGAEGHVLRARAGAEAALDVLTARVGPYPYGTLTVVVPPPEAEGAAGMEYPTLIDGASADPLFESALFGATRFAELTSAHEVCHQYFYGVVANNEQEEAFLDEGFSSYWEIEAMESRWGGPSGLGHFLGRPISVNGDRELVLEGKADRIREPLARIPTTMFYAGTVGTQAYARPAATLLTAAALFGRPVIDRVFAAYFERFAFKHPGREDFLAVAAEVGGAELAAFLKESFLEPRVPDFAVDQLDVAPWTGPLGYVLVGGRKVRIDAAGRGEQAEALVDPSAIEPLGVVGMEVFDPGWIDAHASVTGQARWQQISPHRREPSTWKGSGYFVSQARILGPSWKHLPVEVELRFADGVVVRDLWDGRSAWRGYRFVRPAPLESVFVDPERKIVLDVRPSNNGRLKNADARFVDGFSSFVGAIAGFLAAGASLWF